MKKNSSHTMVKIKRNNAYNSTKKLVISALVCCLSLSCATTPNESNKKRKVNKELTASEILGNPKYQAISYGGYRAISRDIQPTLTQLVNDMKILSAMGIKVLRTYNTHYAQAKNLLEAISQLKQEDPNFEMYVMLGAWIDCKNAFKENPNHNIEDVEANTAEIDRAIKLATTYPSIVKIIAVGNEAMVHWASSYFVKPDVILKWVNYLQDQKVHGILPKSLWITSSDNFASWGGGGSEYHNEDLEALIKAVDYVSMHTYPMHDTHYHPVFWGLNDKESTDSKVKNIELAMDKSIEYAKDQFARTRAYIHNIDSTKELHIGETGWASFSAGHYGDEGSRACDQYKEGLYYKKMREWTDSEGLSCFYFEAFDEIWKDAKNPGGSENHFGIFSIDGEAKYAVWDRVDQGLFKGLTRNGNKVIKSFDGDLEKLLEVVKNPPIMHESVH